MHFQLKNLGYIAVIAGLTLSLSSCIVVRSGSSQTKSSPAVFSKSSKKPHPHGGPPGQTKKSNGHPGKQHN